MRAGIVTFTSDFGWSGGYVAACEAIMVRISREIRVLHVSHEIPTGDVATAALVLSRVVPLCPEAVHLAVVDPGVGTSRRPLALATTRGDILVGPDNGLLFPAGEALGGVTSAWALDIAAVRSAAGLPVAEVSNTFHGRDVFSPASALLATGSDPSGLGQPVDPASLARPVYAQARATERDVSSPVIEVDRFGNVGLGLPFAGLPFRAGPGTTFQVEVVGEGAPEWTARVVRTYGDLAAGELGLIRDSWGQAALTLNGASAAEFLGLRIGLMVTLTPAGEGDDGA